MTHNMEELILSFGQWELEMLNFLQYIGQSQTMKNNSMQNPNISPVEEYQEIRFTVRQNRILLQEVRTAANNAGRMED